MWAELIVFFPSFNRIYAPRRDLLLYCRDKWQLAKFIKTTVIK